MRGRTTLRTLYVPPNACAGLGASPVGLAVAPLMRELILTLTGFAFVDPADPLQAVLAAALLATLTVAPPLGLVLTRPQEPTALRVALGIEADPSREVPLARLATEHGTSLRTPAPTNFGYIPVRVAEAPMRAFDILIVDDDASIRDALSDYLAGHGFRVRTAQDAAAMDRELAARAPDLLLLDLMMPGEDGLAVCRRLAPGGPPVLMLSALGDTTDRIVGLEVGADDYLAKPFDPRELLARVRALLRRRELDASAPAALAFAGWRFEPGERRLSAPDGRSVPLTAGEALLLRTLAERSGRVLSRDQLLDLAWGEDAQAFDRAVDLQVSRLRRKLSDHDPTLLIETVRGEGYRFLPAVRRL